MAESYMKTLKHEEVDAGAYDNLAHAGAAIGEFIETIYDRRRLHSALDYLSPVEFEISQPWAAAQQPMASIVASSPTFTLKNWQSASGQRYAVESRARIAVRQYFPTFHFVHN